MRLLLILVLFALTFPAQAQWTRQKLGDSDFNPGSTLLIDGNTIYVGSAGCVFRSTDGAETFTRQASGITDGGSTVFDMVKIGDRVYVAFGGNGGRGIYYTVDQGENWVIDTAGWAIMPGIPTQMFARRLHNFNNTHLFAILETNFTIFKKLGDAQWSLFPVPYEYRTPSDMFFDGDTIFVASGNYTQPSTVWTTDMGATWTERKGTGRIPLGKIWRNRSGPELYATNQDFAQYGKDWILRSTDNGMRWDTITPRYTTTVNTIYADGDLVIAAYAGSFNNADSTYKIILSKDRGNTWTDISGNYRSLLNFGFHSIYSLGVYGGDLLIGGVGLGTGLLKQKIDLKPTFIDEGSEIPSRIHAYPNPATDVMRLGEPHPGSTYHIYSTDGQLVSSGTIENDVVDISRLPQGSYLLTIFGSEAHKQVRVVKH